MGKGWLSLCSLHPFFSLPSCYKRNKFFPDAYNRKKVANDIEFFPKDPNLVNANIEELAKTHGEDFAKIIKNNTFQVLRYPGILSPYAWLVPNGFNSASKEEIIAKAKQTNFSPPMLKEKIIKMLENECIRDHSKYFALVDFLFSLS